MTDMSLPPNNARTAPARQLAVGCTWLCSQTPPKLDVCRRRLSYPGVTDRLTYQPRHVDSTIAPTERVLDPGSGVDPLRYATRLVETPMLGKNVLFAWAANMDGWHLVAAGPNLWFLEYTPRQLEEIRSSVWQDTMLRKWYHPLQNAFFDNHDLFNVLFTLSARFGYALRLQGLADDIGCVDRMER